MSGLATGSILRLTRSAIRYVADGDPDSPVLDITYGELKRYDDRDSQSVSFARRRAR